MITLTELIWVVPLAGGPRPEARPRVELRRSPVGDELSGRYSGSAGRPVSSPGADADPTSSDFDGSDDSRRVTGDVAIRREDSLDVAAGGDERVVADDGAGGDSGLRGDEAAIADRRLL